MNDNSATIDLFCTSCRVHVEAKIIAEYSNHEEVLEVGDLVNNHYNLFNFTFAICNRCKNPMLARQKFNVIPEEISVPQTEVLVVYPQDDSIPLGSVPKLVAQAYLEAQQAYQVKLYKSCVIMCRQCVEAVCSEHGESKGPLPSRLKRLRESGVIDNAIFDWSNELRLAGNIAAHVDSKSQIMEHDAKDAIEFAKALLLYVFELQSRLQTYRKRRSKQK